MTTDGQKRLALHGIGVLGLCPIGIALGAALAFGQATPLPPGEGLSRIEDGVFELRQGKSVDLTRHAVLLTLRAEQSQRSLEKGQFTVLIAGQQQVVSAGKRIDLKRLRGIEKDLKGRAQCVLDVVDFVAPTGAPATATFRLACL